MKGLGHLNMSVFWTFVWYYLIGLPLAVFFAIYAKSLLQLQNTKILNQIYGLSGLYFGFNIAILMLCLLIANEMFSIKWNETGK